MRDRVAIIGGGMAGLGAAYALSKKGVPSTVFEMASKPGGRMTTEQIGDFHVDVGASFIVKYFGAISKLVKELGMGEELNRLERHSAALYRNGKFHRIGMGQPWSYPFFSGISWRAKLSMAGLVPTALWNIFKINRFLDPYRGLYLDDESAYDWVKRKSSAEAADYFLDPACRALCQYSSREMSRLNLLTYSLMATNMKVMAFRNGMGSVPARLAKGLNVRCGARVAKVAQKQERVEVTWTEGGKTETADFAAAVVAVWGDIVPEIVEGLSHVERAVLDDTRYSTTCPVVLTLDRPLEDPFYGVYIAPGETEIIASFGVEDAKGNFGAPPGKGCLFCLTREEFVRSFKGSKEEIGEITAREAERFFPQIKGRIEGIHTFRWDRAVEKFPAGRMSLLHGMKAQRPPERKIVLAGAYLLAPCTDAAFTTGVRAAGEVLALGK